jgi:hypothetical protein
MSPIGSETRFQHSYWLNFLSGSRIYYTFSLLKKTAEQASRLKKTAKGEI